MEVCVNELIQNKITSAMIKKRSIKGMHAKTYSKLKTRVTSALGGGNGGISICLRSGGSEKPSRRVVASEHLFAVELSKQLVPTPHNNRPQEDGLTLTKRLSVCSCLHFLPAPFGLPFEIKLRPPERKAVEPFVADSLWFVSSPSCAVNIFTRKETKIYNACINLLAIWFIVGVANGFELFELLQQRKRVVSAASGERVGCISYILTSLQVSRQQAAGSKNRVMYKRLFHEMSVEYFIENVGDSTSTVGGQVFFTWTDF